MMWKVGQVCVAIAAATMLSSAIAACQETSSANLNIDYSVWIGAATGEENTNSFGEAQIVTGGFSVGRIVKRVAGTGWKAGDFEYASSVAPLFLGTRQRGFHGVAFEPVILRWNSRLRAGRATPYIELAGGGVRTNGNFPSGDTSNFNFLAKGGGGLYLRSRSREAFDIGLDWSHISNANLGTRNPEFNGIELHFAYHWLR